MHAAVLGGPRSSKSLRSCPSSRQMASTPRTARAKQARAQRLGVPCGSAELGALEPNRVGRRDSTIKAPQLIGMALARLRPQPSCCTIRPELSWHDARSGCRAASSPANEPAIVAATTVSLPQPRPALAASRRDPHGAGRTMGCSKQELKAAFHRRTWSSHPDLVSPEARPEAEVRPTAESPFSPVSQQRQWRAAVRTRIRLSLQCSAVPCVCMQQAFKSSTPHAR